MFFEKSDLSREVLFKVWEMSNHQKLGYLDRLAFHKAMDIIALAQLVRKCGVCIALSSTRVFHWLTPPPRPPPMTGLRCDQGELCHGSRA